jgi:hypothetical protein
VACAIDIRLRELLRDSMPTITNADEARPQISVAVLSLRSLHLLQMATIYDFLQLTEVNITQEGAHIEPQGADVYRVRLYAVLGEGIHRA